MGDVHSTILSSNKGESVQAFADRFTNAATVLRQNVTDVLAADEAFARTLDTYINIVELAASVALPGITHTELTTPARSVVNTDTQPLAFSMPVVTRPATLMELIGQFSSTNHGIPPEMAGDWSALATQIDTAANSLETVIAELESSSETEAIQRAMDNIRLIQATGFAFGNNARSLALNTDSLGIGGAAHAQRASQVATLYLTVSMTNPTLASTIEQTYLGSFPPSMTTTLVPSLPAIDRLLPPMSDPGGGSAGELGAIGEANPGTRLTAWENVPLPAVVQDTMEEFGMAEAARMNNPVVLAEEFNRNGPDNLEAIMAGHAPTTAASAGAPAMPPTLTHGTQVGTAMPGYVTSSPGGTTGFTTPASVNGTLPNTGMPAMGRQTATAGGDRASLGALGNSGVGAHGAPGRFNTSPATPTTTGSRGLHATGADHATRRGGTPSFTGGASPRGGVSTSHGSHTSGSHGSTPPHSTGKTPTGSATPGVMGTSPGTGTTAGKPSSSTGQARGMMPMGGMMGAGNGQRQRNSAASPVRKVTSAVERKGNLKALLGEGPEVIPGVIGAWVREPRTDR